MKISMEERVAFDMYFATLMGFQMHPGAGTKDHEPKTIHECRDIAWQMLGIRRKLFEET